MNKLLSTFGAALGHFLKAFTMTLGVLFALWLFVDAETVGQWQAWAELAFVVEADRINLWQE